MYHKGLPLAISLIKGTQWEGAIVDFKKKRMWNPLTSSGERKQVPGQGWYHGFGNKTNTYLRRRKVKKFAKKHSEWSIHQNFVQMYNEVYEGMEKAGVASLLVNAIWVDKDQKETNKENVVGRVATHLLNRPDYVIFVDETGSNMSQEDDGAVGGERKFVSQGTVPKESAATNSNHFISFTVATGEPIMFAVIVSGKSIRPEVITSLDIFANCQKNGVQTDVDFVEQNTSPGKLYSCGSTCEFKGKQVPCMVCNMENGSITSEILKMFLE
jgi:hypothetical protein